MLAAPAPAALSPTKVLFADAFADDEGPPYIRRSDGVTLRNSLRLWRSDRMLTPAELSVHTDTAQRAQTATEWQPRGPC